MKTLALIIEQNQNPVSREEIAKIKRSVRKFYNASDYKINVYANDEALNPYTDDINEHKFILFLTSDINNIVRSWSEVSSDNYHLKLNL